VRVVVVRLLQLPGDQRVLASEETAALLVAMHLGKRLDPPGPKGLDQDHSKGFDQSHSDLGSAQRSEFRRPPVPRP